MKHIYISIILLYSVLPMTSQSQDEFPVLEGPYLGQKLPGLTPEVFAPGIISTKGWEYGVVFAPGMKEIYFIREVDAETNPKEEFVVFERINNRWHERVISPRRGTPTLSPDGKIMYFGRSYRERTDTGWSEPKKLGPDFEEIAIMRVTASAKGTYVLDEAAEKSVLRYSRLVDGVREAPKPLPEQINTGEHNAHPFIAPDESYIIWDGQRNSPVRNADLFISFRQSDGTWGEAIKMGDTINTGASEFAAFVTPDGKYLFFNRDMGPDNTDTFWVDARIIDNLRHKQKP
ncbi:MAG: hypothetical protein ACSHWU_13410 [Marinicella sp.]